MRGNDIWAYGANLSSGRARWRDTSPTGGRWTRIDPRQLPSSWANAIRLSPTVMRARPPLRIGESIGQIATPTRDSDLALRTQDSGLVDLP